MKKDNKSFTKEFFNYLKINSKKKPFYSSVQLIGINNGWDNGIIIRFNHTEYTLCADFEKYNDSEATYIQLNDFKRDNKRKDVLHLTIKSNFKIVGNKFTLYQNRVGTIGQITEGIKERFQEKMYELGFNKDNIILTGDFKNPDFNQIASDFFKWLRIRTIVKLNLEGEKIMDEVLYEFDHDYEIESKTEGGRIVFISSRYERNPSLRIDALRIHGYTCKACGFNFEKKYGEWGKDFAEVHHIVPLSSSKGKKREINPKTDLNVVCSNCHKMIHRKRGITLTIDELKLKLKDGRK